MPTRSIPTALEYCAHIKQGVNAPWSRIIIWNDVRTIMCPACVEMTVDVINDLNAVMPS